MVSLAETPLTGEPDAGEPPVRFGGRGGAHPAIPPLSDAARDRRRHARSRQRMERGSLPPLCVSWSGVEPGPLQASRAANDSAYNRPFLQMKGGLPSRPALEERVPPRPMEGHLPRRPLAAVEPGPPWNRYHGAGVEPGLLTGCYHHGWKQGRSGIEREQAAARGEWSSGRGAIWGNTGSGGTIRARIGGRRAGPWGGGGELRGGSVSIPVKRPVGGPGQGGRCVRLGDFPAQRVPAPAVPDSHPAKGCRN